MDLIKAKELSESLIRKHLGKSKNKWFFMFDNARRSFGQCKWGIGGYRITLSRHLTLINDETKVRNTILHEIAHALDIDDRGYSNHDANWRQIALSIGCDGERCFSSKDVNIPTTKYTLKCENCGYETGKMKKSTTKTTACGKCCREHNGGKFTEKFKLIYKQNY